MGWLETHKDGLVDTQPPTVGAGWIYPEIPSLLAVSYGGGQPFKRILPLVPWEGVPPLPSLLLLQAAGVPTPSLTPAMVDPGAPSTSIPCTGLVEERVRG